MKKKSKDTKREIDGVEYTDIVYKPLKNGKTKKIYMNGKKEVKTETVSQDFY